MGKKFTLPESITELSTEQLAELRATARAEIDEINAADGDLSVEQLDALEALMADVDTIDQRIVDAAAEADALEARRAAARERVAGLDNPIDTETPAAEAEVVVEEPAAEVVEEVVETPEPVLASAGVRKSTVAAAKRKAPAIVIPKEEPVGPQIAITAAANVPDFNAGAPLADMGEVAQAFAQRVQSFGGSNDPKMKAGVYQMSSAATRHGVARIRREDRQFSVDREMSVEKQLQVIMDASNESTLSGGSVIAAGGWCAPSETIYELFSYHTSEGTLDVPEVTARRGGIQFTKGPDFMSIFGDTDAGFIMTEAQAEAGSFVKPCYALECPPFEEVRLDAIGFCATAPLLTNAAYPELTRQVLDMLGAGHARRKSLYSIQKIAAAAGAAINWGEIGGAGASGLADALGALELQALRIRQSLAMAPDATIEGFAPYWWKAAARFELSRRLGLTDPFAVTDADVERYLNVRGIRLQFVYDYQMLTAANTASWTAWPTTVEFTLYPAGAFVRLVNDVISLDAVYDHDLLTQNEYTAAFVEEGMAIANTRGFAVKVAVDLNYNGSAGFPAIGAGSGVTFAVPTP